MSVSLAIFPRQVIIQRMTTKDENKYKKDLSKFQEFLGELAESALTGLSANSESAAVLKKHWLLAQTELLKGLQEVVKMELAKTDSPEPAKRTKIEVK